MTSLGRFGYRKRSSRHHGAGLAQPEMLIEAPRVAAMT
jgi:hypothetical protein